MKEWLYKLKGGLQRAMYGRYGADRLNGVLLLAGVVLSLLSSATGWYWLNLLSLLPIGYALYRMFSKNIGKRTAENEKYLAFRERIKREWTRQKQMIRGCGKYKFFRCPTCRQTLRLPRHKGKVEVTCPKCRTKFVKKT